MFNADSLQWELVPGNGSGKKKGVYNGYRSWPQVRNKLINMLINRFEWSNLPDTIGRDGEYFLERTLIFNGKALFVRDKAMGDMILSVGTMRNVNIYGRPTIVGGNAWGNVALDGRVQGNQFGEYINFVGNNRDKAECIIMKDNPLEYPIINELIRYAYVLADTYNSIIVSHNHNKMPRVPIVDKQSEPIVSKILEQVDANSPSVIGLDFSHALDGGVTDLSDVLDIGLPAGHLQGMWYSYSQFKSDIFESLGFPNNPVEKSAQLISTEIDSNNQVTDTFMDICLRCRQTACEQINNVFGTNISVGIRKSATQDNAAETQHAILDNNERGNSVK